MVMVVVPALSQGDQSQQQVVAAVVPGVEALTAEDVGEGIDRVGAVIQQHRGDEEPPHQHLRS